MDNPTTIHFAYSLFDNLLVTDAVFGIHLLPWAIPFLLLISYLRKRTSLQKPLWALLIVCLLFYWDYSFLNSRFGTIDYNKGTVTLTEKSGRIVSLNPQQIERFLAITNGINSDDVYCYLLVVGKNKNYRSFTVGTYSHSCLKDAETLNLFYRKTLPTL